MNRVIFHIDVNSAYLSWTAVEQLKSGSSLDIRTIPAIIGGDRASRHGVVLAKSIPAKKYGIVTGEPVANALRKCPNLHMEPPDHKMYHRYSQALMEFLKTYSREIEQVSVDECYMDFTEAAKRYSSPVEGALELKNEVKHRFGFTVNVGISSNKLLAKMASDFEKPDKVHTLFPQEIQVKMWPLPVRDLYMAGKSSTETLKKLEIYTIGDLANTDPAILELHLKSHGRRLWEFANGIGDDQVISEPPEAKGIGNSVTLPKDAETEEEAEAVLEQLAQSVSRRLKKAGQKAGMLSVEIKYYTFEIGSHHRQLSKPTYDARDIYQEAVSLFLELWNHQPIRLLGIRSSKLSEKGEPEQLSIFDIQVEPEEKRRKKRQLKEAMEQLKGKYGKEVVRKGTGSLPKQGVDKF